VKEGIVEVLDGRVPSDCPGIGTVAREVFLDTKADEALRNAFAISGTDNVGSS
jgi:hypothetical protein